MKNRLSHKNEWHSDERSSLGFCNVFEIFEEIYDVINHMTMTSSVMLGFCKLAYIFCIGHHSAPKKSDILPKQKDLVGREGEKRHIFLHLLQKSDIKI